MRWGDPWQVQVRADNGLFTGGQVQVSASALTFDRDATKASANGDYQVTAAPERVEAA